MRILINLTCFLVCVICATNTLANSFLVYSKQDISKVQKEIKPGDSLIFANKIWNNSIDLNFKGTQKLPIYVVAQEFGKVIFSGSSSLKIGGSFIVVEGLVFKDINTKNPIIQFRIDKNNLANNCRVTNCVIDNCNPSEKLVESNWINFYGRNNRFDHNSILNKKNLGTTLIVDLSDTSSQNNFHSIDHNYFGTRLKAGSNGGEIIRVGNSTFSRTSSRTIIESNYFEKCNGEVEIISIKSCDNIVKKNTFYECEGGLVLRHGNRNLVEENFFIGNDKMHTGGIRVINAGHIVRNNFFYKLGGERFRSAFTIMNGVPNSPINRYDQVKNVSISNNVFIDCKNVEFCAGKDFERTAKPENVIFSSNTFYNSKTITQFVINDDINGIKFSNNVSTILNKTLPPNLFKKQSIDYLQKDNFQWVINTKNYSAYATRKNTGASWYKDAESVTTHPGKKIMVNSGDNTLYEKTLTANDNDTLVLSLGVFNLSKTINVNKNLVFVGSTNNNSKSIIQFVGERGGFVFFNIENGGSISLLNIRMNGLSENGVAESFIQTSTSGMIEQYNLFVDGCDFLNITDGRKHALKINKASFADSIQFKNCLFSNISGEVISIAAEKEDKGIYNAENIVFINCVFNKILVGAIDLYRGGNDESTTGPYFTMDHCTFNEVGNVELCSVVRLFGVQYSLITNCIFNNSGRSGRMVNYEDFGWTKNNISYCNSYGSGTITSFYKNIIGKNMTKVKTEFENIGTENFKLKTSSLLKNKGNDGKDLGAIWVNGQLKL